LPAQKLLLCKSHKLSWACFRILNRFLAEHFVLFFDVSPLLEAQEVLRRAEGIGFVHCTNDTPPNEWDTLPAYWEEWVELFRQPLYYVP
jgi:hypothetical protein